MRPNILYCLILMPFTIFGQVKKTAKFVVEEGRFLFDNQSYAQHKKASELFTLNRNENLRKSNPKNITIEIDDRQLIYPRFDSATSVFRYKLFENLKIVNAKLGQNTYSLLIDKNGKPKQLKCLKNSEKDICKQLKQLIFTKEFNKWKPANYYGTDVNYDFRFSIIIDDDFSKYNLKNKWSQKSNISDFTNNKI